MEAGVLPREQLDTLVQALAAAGYRVFGPVPRAGAVVFDEIASAAELPRGLVSRQEPGRYRLEPSGNDRWFDFVNGHESLKRFTFAPEERLWHYSADGRFTAAEPDPRPTAVIGARACDLAGMQVQDRTFLAGEWAPFTDPYYATRRHHLFVVAVNCTRAAATCFCASQSAGPKAGGGYDLALTEMDEGLLVEAGSEAGEAIAMRLHLRAADGLMDEAMAAIEACGASQSRYIDNDGLFDLLMANLDHPRWDDVAARCLSCANCVMVCPTCFCHREHDVAAMDGSGADHVRQWDACFTLEHGSVHGGQLRPGVRERYRQWLTHKVGSWQPQFGTSGCVGCGRCITWCPTGIDLTEEIAVIRAQPGLTR